ncbi:Uncharacterised protein [Bordetella ansorpii]|uniref:DUF7256 domain-containing protein n=2 Tax=Bordetella ansorpii TaxID=288768 RepID=A0A157SM10_9BORD|nr:Uncharacterised protein [Bordetella ansorpii]
MAAEKGDPDMQALADIRPGDAKEKLAAAVGERWRDPRPEETGHIRYLEEAFAFTARLDRYGRVGRTEFTHRFDPEARIAGLHLGMAEADAERVPGLNLGKPVRAGFPYRFGYLQLPDGVRLLVQVGHGRVTELSLSRDTEFPDLPMPLPKPTMAIDVRIVPGPQARDAEAPDGWAYGLPRGITPAQWPLSNRTGFPMEHHFTVRVPAQYRTKGPQYVALAFFSDTAGETDVSEEIIDLMDRIYDGRGLPDKVGADLQPFADHLRQRHPMEFRCKDILYASFAAIWLTEADFKGKVCEPPKPARTPANAMCEVPPWLSTSAIQRIFGENGRAAYDPRQGLHRMVGGKPAEPWEILRLRATERTDDPNIGRTPTEDQENADGYIARYSEEWEARKLDVSYGDLHFGGTASPAQAMPDLSPFYIEFEESMGLPNFGTGNCQLDLVSMQLDWAQ